jgi:hypothetical protein
MFELEGLETAPNMNVSGEGQSKKCLVEFVLIYPFGVLPPGTPEDYQPEGRIESYDHRFLPRSPQVGDRHQFGNLTWLVVEATLYKPENEDAALTQEYWVVVCSQDGEPVLRNDWFYTGDHFAYIPILKNGQIARNSDGSSLSGLVNQVKHIPWNDLFEDWEFDTVQWFVPADKRPTQGYDKIALCWCICNEVAIAA